MQDKIILPNAFLEIAEEELKQGKSVKILADGASMYPFIHGGKDIAEVYPLKENEDLKRWNVYLFKKNGKYIIHRLIKKEPNYLLMMGDGNRGIYEKIRENDVLGILRYVYCDNGNTIDCSSSAWLSKGRFWYALRPLRRYLLAIVRRLYRYGIIR